MKCKVSFFNNDLSYVVDVAARIKFMIIHGYFDEAKNLQNEFGDLLDFMKGSIPEIFTAHKKLTMEELKEKWINDPISLAEMPMQSLPPVIAEKKWKAELISR